MVTGLQLQKAFRKAEVGTKMIQMNLQESMNTYRFTKEVEGWYIDFPEHLQKRCNEVRQQMTAGAKVILNKIAGSAKEIRVVIDTQPFRDAVILELVNLCNKPWGGGYYRLRNGRGKVERKKMWLCDIPLFVFGDLPEKIYIKKVTDN